MSKLKYTKPCAQVYFLRAAHGPAHNSSAKHTIKSKSRVEQKELCLYNKPTQHCHSVEKIFSD